MTLLLTTFIVTPVWFFLMRVLGKPRAFMLGLVVSVPAEVDAGRLLINPWS